MVTPGFRRAEAVAARRECACERECEREREQTKEARAARARQPSPPGRGGAAWLLRGAALPTHAVRADATR